MSSKKTQTPTREEIADAIQTAWRLKSISQKEVERDLGIHQSQFSKLVNGKFKKSNGHAIRLFEYSNRKRDLLQPQSCNEMLRLTLTERLMRAWDGTTEGARALEAILDGATRLRARGGRS